MMSQQGQQQQQQSESCEGKQSCGEGKCEGKDGKCGEGKCGDGGKKCARADYLSVLCPVDGKCVSKSGPHLDTPQAILKHGQRIFFCSPECCEKFKNDVTKCMRAPGDPKWEQKPWMQDLAMPCCDSKTGQWKIREDTPRILFKYGQTLWFCNFSCMGTFLKDPAGAFQPSLTTSLTGMVLGGSKRGSDFTSTCPVTGRKFPIECGTPHVEFAHGQRIYFCCSSCPVELGRNVNGFIKHPTDPYLHAQMPVLNGLICKCVHCAHTLVIDEEHTPRVQFKGGQNLFFKTNYCVDQFLLNPQKYLKEIVDAYGTTTTTKSTSTGSSDQMKKDEQWKPSSKEKEVRGEQMSSSTHTSGSFNNKEPLQGH